MHPSYSFYQQVVSDAPKQTQKVKQLSPQACRSAAAGRNQGWDELKASPASLGCMHLQM